MAQHQNVDLSEFGTHDMSSPTDTETETSESTISSPLTGDPDPCGDVILVIGSGEEVKRLKVATKVLTLASAMFAGMCLLKHSFSLPKGFKHVGRCRRIVTLANYPTCYALRFEREC